MWLVSSIVKLCQRAYHTARPRAPPPVSDLFFFVFIFFEFQAIPPNFLIDGALISLGFAWAWIPLMARLVPKHGPRKYVVVLACISLLGVALVADFLWASSSSSSSLNWSNSLDVSLNSPRAKPKAVSFLSLFLLWN